jgi:hypothetical protein
MPRKIPGPVPGALIEFVPKAFGNALEAEPVRVLIRAPSERERREHFETGVQSVTIKMQNGKPVLDEKGEPIVEVKLADRAERRDAAIRRFVDHVEGYVDQADAPISTAADLAERGELEVLNEVEAKINALLGLTEDEQKKSDESSGSPRPATQASVGTAVNALPEGSHGSATASIPRATLSFDTTSRV